MRSCSKCTHCVMKVHEDGIYPYCQKFVRPGGVYVCKEYTSTKKPFKIAFTWLLYSVWNEVVKTLCRIIFYIPHKRAKAEDIPTNSEYCDKCPHYRYIEREYDEDSVWCVYCNDNDGMLLWDGIKICGEGLIN